MSKAKSPIQEKWMGKALDIYGPTLGQGEKIYQGERLAPLTPTQTQASDVQGFINRFAPYRDIPLFGETGTALSGILKGETGARPITPEATEAYFQGKIADPAYKRYREDVLPATREAYAGPGFWGSARAKAQTETAQDLADWLGEQRAGLEWDVDEVNRQIEEAKAGRALSAIAPAITYGGVPTAEAQQRLAGRAGVLELAGVPQQQAQREIDTAIQKFAEENRLTAAEDMQILLALLGMDYGSAVSSQKGAGLGYSMLSSLAGGAGLGFGSEAGSKVFSALAASDIKVKENVTPFTNALDKIRKLKAYVYNYKGRTEKDIGLMAQDVEKVLPEAVTEINGVKHVKIYSIYSLIVAAINEIMGASNGGIRPYRTDG